MKRKELLKNYGKKAVAKSVVPVMAAVIVTSAFGFTALAAPGKSADLQTGTEMTLLMDGQTETDLTELADAQIKAQIEEERGEILLEKQTKVEVSGQVIADEACQYVGILPYVWAGSSLETGVDCSGFTMALYARYGYELSHDSDTQSQQGRSVSLEEAQPGDIVVYAGHVALYIGDGKIVHAPQSGQCVSVADVDYMPVLDVRRILD